MNYFLNNILSKINQTKYYLIAVNFLLVFFLVLLFNLQVLPMKTGDFIFFSLIYLIFALYRPGWSFLFFVGTIVLENINLAPESLGIFVRPYQAIGALTVFSLLLRYFSKRLNFGLVKLKWFDFLIFGFGVSGIVSSIFSQNKVTSLKQSFILLTFIVFYWLARNYVQTLEDAKKIVPFFLSYSAGVVFYGIWQNFRFIYGGNSFEVMAGRPNATFMEPDWLGVYLVLLIAVIYTIIYSISNFQTVSPADGFPVSNEFSNPDFQTDKHKKYLILYTLYILLIPVYVLLILTVSRSAWLGAIFVTLVFLKFIFTKFSFKFREWQGKQLLRHFLFISGSGLISVAIVYVFSLTGFQLFNRVQSTGSGLQIITVSCVDDFELPEKIENVAELGKYNCRHINLEEITKEKSEGKFIKEVFRDDPNIAVRSQIYQKSITEIKNHPIFGIGWGSIPDILGKDERGMGFNSSNIFLEVYLGSGVSGILIFLTLGVYIFGKSVSYCIRGDYAGKVSGLLINLSFFALLIPNLFNAGVFLGILWFWLAVSLSSSLVDSNKA
jgi:hypothetical protein